jgi:hypothetical protein
MPSRSHRQRQGARARARQARSARRARLLAVAVVLGALSIGVLATSGWGWDSARAPIATASGSGVAGAKPLPTGLPQPIVVAQVGGATPVPLKLPIAAGAITAIGYHAAPGLALTPYGHRANEGTLTHLWHRIFGGNTRGLRYYQLSGGRGPATAELNVGAAPGTDVYSPINGTVTGITPVVIDGKPYGVRLDIRSQDAPSIIVSLTNVVADPALHVGSALTASVSLVGQVISMSVVEQQALARFTNDDGDHVGVTASQQAQ